jgi:predicted permease
VGATGRSVAPSLAATAQLALAVLLVVGSGLLLRSVRILSAGGPGFEAAGLSSLEYRLPRGRYATPEAQWEFHRRVLAEAGRLPGVTSAAVVSGLPLSGNGGSVTYGLPGAPPPEEGRAPRAIALSISPGYFETMGLPILAGRGLGAEDGSEAPLVVVVNQVLAASLWPGASPVGRRLALLSEGVEVEVVGLTPAARQFDLAEEPLPQLYVSYAQNPGIFATLVARTTADAEGLGEGLRAAVWAVDPDQPVWKVRSVEALVANRLAPRRLLALLTAALAGVALLLTTVGLYGLLAYRVAVRRREFGLRLALGADPGWLARRVIGATLRLALPGVAAGALAAWGATRWMRSLLWQVEPLDPLTYAVAAVLVAGVAVLAALGPARRAARVDPALALRSP